MFRLGSRLIVCICAIVLSCGMLASQGSASIQAQQTEESSDPGQDQLLPSCVMVDDSYKTTMDVPVSIPAPGVFRNDVLPGPYSLSRVSTPAHGSVSFQPSGEISYAPNPGFTGTDSFTYTAFCGSGDVGTYSSATVWIKVGYASSCGIPGDDFYTTRQGVMLVVPAPGVFANDTGASTYFAASIGVPSPNGTATITDTGRITFLPNPGFVGVTTFGYTAQCGSWETTSATVTITVTP